MVKILNSYSKINSDFGIVANYNTTVKTYSDGSKKIVYTSYDKIKGTERKSNSGVGKSSEEELERYKLINLQRVKQKIVDLAYENGCVFPWEYFVTLTFDDFIVDGYSHEKVTKKLTQFLDTQKHLNPDMEYLLVPELHKSGRLHFHGLFRSVPKWSLSPAISPKTGRAIYKNGSPIFNLDNYRLGYTTVSKIKNQEAVTVYISKYITKGLLDLKNKKHYWRSKSLRLPIYEYYNSNLNEIKNYIQDYNVTYEKINDSDNQTTAFFSISASSYN